MPLPNKAGIPYHTIGVEIKIRIGRRNGSLRSCRIVKKAITHLKLDQANPGKLERLDELAVEHQRIVQAYVDWMISHEIRQPDKYDHIPEQDIATTLSDRWQRCAWQQACGIVQSWYSNARENPPKLQNICLQANTNVVVIEHSKTAQFDYWLRISTLAAGISPRASGPTLSSIFPFLLTHSTSARITCRADLKSWSAAA